MYTRPSYAVQDIIQTSYIDVKVYSYVHEVNSGHLVKIFLAQIFFLPAKLLRKDQLWMLWTVESSQVF